MSSRVVIDAIADAVISVVMYVVQSLMTMRVTTRLFALGSELKQRSKRSQKILGASR